MEPTPRDSESVRPPQARQVHPDVIKESWSRPWAGTAITLGVTSIVVLLLALLLSVSGSLGSATLPVYDDQTTGTVTGLSSEHYTELSHDPCGPQYRFSVGGTDYAASSPNVDEQYCRFEVGDPIDITFDGVDPAGSNAPAPHYTDSQNGSRIAAGVGVVLLVLAIASWVIAARRRS